MRNTSDSTVPGDGTVSNGDFFSLIPSFKEVHVIRLIGGVLICNCGRKRRFGIPCRHLFRIEANYNDQDIHHRWSVAYSMFAHDSNYGRLTMLYEKLRQEEHNGLVLKTELPDCSAYPYLFDGSQYSVDDFQTVKESEVPLCWNIKCSDYPTKYQLIGASACHDDASVSFDCHGDLTQESVVPGVADDFSIQNLEVPLNVVRREVNDANIFTQLRSMLLYFNSPELKSKLLPVSYTHLTLPTKRIV